MSISWLETFYFRIFACKMAKRGMWGPDIYFLDLPRILYNIIIKEDSNASWMNELYKTSFSFDSKCDFFSVLDSTPRTSSSSWPNGRGHSSPVESVSKKNYWCYSTDRLVLLSYIPSVCPIWKGLTLFYYHREANHILALSMAAFCMILAYILIFEKNFGFCDRWFFTLEP